MSSALEETSLQIEHIRETGRANAEAKKIAAFNQPTFERLEKKMARFGKESEPLPHDVIHQDGMMTIHGFSSQ